MGGDDANTRGEPDALHVAPAVLDAVAPRKHPNLRRPWQKGQSGNPRGKKPGPNAAARLAQAMIDQAGDDIVAKAIELAKGGDKHCLRMIFDRLCPPRREMPVSFEMPHIKAADDLVAASSAIASAVSSGELMPGEASALANVVGTVGRAMELHSLVERIAKLEQAAAERGQP
jgi:Family of unknown function (DUF5681)